MAYIQVPGARVAKCRQRSENDGLGPPFHFRPSAPFCDISFPSTRTCSETLSELQKPGFVCKVYRTRVVLSPHNNISSYYYAHVQTMLVRKYIESGPIKLIINNIIQNIWNTRPAWADQLAAVACSGAQSKSINSKMSTSR